MYSQVDTLDDPTFLGNAWGVGEFAAAEYHRALELETARFAEQARDLQAGGPASATTPNAAAAATATASAADTSSSHASGTVRTTNMFDSMEGLLHDPATLEDFQTKLEAEFAAESLLFYRATLEFDELIATRDRATPIGESEAKTSGDDNDGDASALEAKCYAKAVAIFDEFIKPNSNNQVGIRIEVLIIGYINSMHAQRHSRRSFFPHSNPRILYHYQLTSSIR